MQNPASSDPSFKAFLDKLQEQNNRGFLTQIAQLRAEKETAGEDADKREQQLDQVNENLSTLTDKSSSVGTSIKEGLQDLSDDIVEVQDILDIINGTLEGVRTAITGLERNLESGHLVAVTGAIGANTTKLLDEQLKELSLVRKLTEGSVEYDKEAAQYRNTSGRDIESKVSGKTSKSGGFIDFETARDTLSGQGERARQANKISLITGVTTTRPGDTTYGAMGGSSEGSRVEKRSRRSRDESVTSSPGSSSISSDSEDIEKSKWQGLFKEIEAGFKFFMTDGLSEKPGYGIFQTPPKDVVKKDREAKVSSPRQENPEADNITSTGEIQADAAKSDLELSKQMLDTTRESLAELKAIREALAPSTPKELVEQKSAPSSTNEKEDSGGSLLGGVDIDLPGRRRGRAGKAAGMGGKILGGLGKAARVLGPAAAIAATAYSGFEGYQNTNANFDLKEGEDATLGQKASSTLGGVASGLTFGLVDEKSAAQGIHKAGSAVGDFFGGIGDKVKSVYSGSVTGGVGQVQADQAVSSNTVSGTTETSGQGLTTSTSAVKQGITAEKSVLGSTFLGGLFTAKGKESGNFTATSTEETSLKGKVEGREIDNTSTKSGQVLGRRISGGLFGADTYKVTNKAGEEQEVNKYEYNKLQALAKEGKVDEVHASLDKMAAAKAAAAEPSGYDAMGNLTGGGPSYVGKDVVQASTENKDMEREARGKGGANNTVVSNNVSSNNTTKIVPMKATPRPEFTGSSLDRYNNRIAVY